MDGKDDVDAHRWASVLFECAALWLFGGFVLGTVCAVAAVATFVAYVTYQSLVTNAALASYLSGTAFAAMVVFYVAAMGSACVLPAAPASIAATYVLRRGAGTRRVLLAGASTLCAAYLSTRAAGYASAEPWRAIFVDSPARTLSLFAVTHAVLTAFVLWLPGAMPSGDPVGDGTAGQSR